MDSWILADQALRFTARMRPPSGCSSSLGVFECQLPVGRHNRPICAHSHGVGSLRVSSRVLASRLESRAREVRVASSERARRNISGTCRAESKASMTPSRRSQRGRLPAICPRRGPAHPPTSGDCIVSARCPPLSHPLAPVFDRAVDSLSAALNPETIPRRRL